MLFSSWGSGPHPPLDPHNTSMRNVFFLVAFPWVVTSTGPGGFMILTGTPEGSIESGFKEKPGIEPATHWFKHIQRDTD